MLGVSRADDANHALALDDLAVLTYRLDAAANFHLHLLWTRKIPQMWGFERISELAFENTEPVEASQHRERAYGRFWESSNFIKKSVAV